MTAQSSQYVLRHVNVYSQFTIAAIIINRLPPTVFRRVNFLTAVVHLQCQLVKRNYVKTNESLLYYVTACVCSEINISQSAS